MKYAHVVLLVCLVGVSLFESSFGLPVRGDGSTVVAVESGTHITRTEEGIYVSEPSGKKSFSENIKEKNPEIKKRGEGKKRYEEAGGWVANLWADGRAYNYFKAYWFVPPKPTTTSDEQILFIFNSFEDSTETEILQPVLDWNRINTNQWSLACWYGTGKNNSNYHYSTAIPVNPGDLITGILTVSNGEWLIEGYVNYALVTSISVSYSLNSQIQPYAQLVLETYYINACTDYPPSQYLTFDYITIEDGGTVVNPTWTVESTSQTACSEYAQTSPGLTLGWYT